MAIRQSKGKQGEGLAAAYLEQHGLRIACRNFRCPLGEIDLVGWDGQVVVFVEVRTRYSGMFGLAEDSISRSKRRRLTRLARWYIRQNRLEGRAARFDVIAIDWQSEEPAINWIVNAFDACE